MYHLYLQIKWTPSSLISWKDGNVGLVPTSSALSPTGRNVSSSTEQWSLRQKRGRLALAIFILFQYKGTCVGLAF